MLSGVRPTISFASAPTARTIFPGFWRATTVGSLITIPLSGKKTSVFVVPKSMPIFRTNMVFFSPSTLPHTDVGFKFPRIPVRKESQIGLKGLVVWIRAETLQHSSLRRRAEHAMVGKVHPAKEIDAGCECGDRHFVRMK